MLEKPFYSGLYKEGFVCKEGNLKDSPEYNRFSDIIQKIDQNNRLLYLEWDGTSFFIGVQFHCTDVTKTDGGRVRNSRRMYFEQVPYGKNDPPILPQILQQFYIRADKTIKTFYSEKYKFQMRLATSGDFTEFISNYNPKISQSVDNEISKYFGGKILFNERCSVLSSDFIKSIKMITDLFEILKRDKTNIVFIISELDNPNDTKLVWDFLISIPTQTSNKNQNIQSFTYNANTQTFSESSFTQGLYKFFDNYCAENRSLDLQDSNTIKNHVIKSYLSSKESSKLPIGELCKSNLGVFIATELIIKKLQNNEKIESEILKLVYTSLTGEEQVSFGRTLLSYDYDFPELYSGAIKKLMSDGDSKFLSYFISKDFPEYCNFHTGIANTFKKLPWDNPKLRNNAKKILESIFSKHPVESVGEGGRIFTRLLFQNMSDHQEIDKEFIKKYSEKMKIFEIDVPIIPDNSLFKNTKLRWSIIGYGAFAAGILFAWIFNYFYTQVLPNLLEQLNGFIDPTIQVRVLICVLIIILLLLGYWTLKRKSKKKIVQKYG